MGEIGSGTGTSYPGAFDVDSIPEVNAPLAGKTKARAEVVKDLAAAILAVQQELGTDPAGTLTDVKTYLQLQHNSDGTHDASLVALLAGAQTLLDKTLGTSSNPTVDIITKGPWVDVRAHGAKGDGVADDTASIQEAVTALPSNGGVLLFPPTSGSNFYKITGPTILSKRNTCVFGYGAVIKPTVDTDVFRTTAAGISIQGLFINGTLVSSGSGSGVVIGYGGAKAAQNSIIDMFIEDTPGHGILWEEGSHLYISPSTVVQIVRGDGLRASNNYEDNNHGIIGGSYNSGSAIGIRIMDNASVPNNSSRHHQFLNAKIFGNSGGGIQIETRENVGSIFLELNSVFGLNLTSTSKANHIEIVGDISSTFTDSGVGNMVMFENSFERRVYNLLRTHELKVRNTANVGGIRFRPTADYIFDFKTDAGSATLYSIRFDQTGDDGGTIAAIFGQIHIQILATGALPAAGASQNGRVIIEDAGAGDRNLIIYAGGQRFRIDGGTAF